MQRPAYRTNTIFRDLADAVERLGENEVQRILRNAVGATSSDDPTSFVKKTKGRIGRPIRLDLIGAVSVVLKGVDSREQAKVEIQNSEFSRKELEQLARSLNVPVRKDMKVNEVIDLIVNMTVGGRLNSKAIRGNV